MINEHDTDKLRPRLGPANPQHQARVGLECEEAVWTSDAYISRTQGAKTYFLDENQK